jgi:hypothetical protein
MPAKTTAKKTASTKVSTPKKKRVVKKITVPSVVVRELCSACLTVLPEQAFWVNNGPVVNSLKGLKQALQDMSDAQFRYHTERAGNDFATWVRDCLGDIDAATRLSKAKTKDASARAIICTCPA